MIRLDHDGRLLGFRLVSVADAESRSIEAIRQDRQDYDLPPGAARPAAPSKMVAFGAPEVVILDLPQLTEGHAPHHPLIAAHAVPWPGQMAVFRSPGSDGFELVTTFSARAHIGTLVNDLWSGPVSRFDHGNVMIIDLVSGTLESVTDMALFGGANVLAVESAPGTWEILQAGSAELIAPGRYRLTRLLRGQRGTEQAMGSPTPAGARVVVLDSMLDGLVQLSVKDRDLTAPPASPADRDRYIVASGATGAWAGWDLNVALWVDGAWLRLPPRAGWRAWVEDEGLLLVYNGSTWIGTTPTTLQNLALLGLGTTADAANPFSAKLNAALWTAKTVAEGGTGDLFYTMNKEAAGDDLGLTLQTGYVTKALMGLFGSDRFRLAVSADGSSFFDGLIVDNATGIVDQPRLPRFKGYTNYDNYVAVDTWTKIGINNTDYNDQGAFDAANNRFVAPVDGTYLFGATLMYKVNASTTARMRGRLVLNGTTEIRGSLGEISATHVSLATAIWLQTMVPLTAGDTVELQGYFRVADGYFAADQTSFWGCKVG